MSLSIKQGSYYSTSGNAVSGVEPELSLWISALVCLCVVSLVMVELKTSVLETETYKNLFCSSDMTQVIARDFTTMIQLIVEKVLMHNARLL